MEQLLMNNRVDINGNWLGGFPQDKKNIYPNKSNEPINYYQLCYRLGKRVLVDLSGKCMQMPKFDICGGCICLEFKDVTVEQLGGKVVK